MTVTPLAAQVDGLADGLGDHRAGHRVDGRAAQLEPEARLGDHAHAHAAVQLEARLAAPAHGGGQPRAVGHVGVVTGVLDHHGHRLGWFDRAFVHGEADPLAGRQADLHGVLRLVCGQRGGGRLGRGGRAGPGGPAGAQRLLPHLRGPRQVGLAQLGIWLTFGPLCPGAASWPGVRPSGTRGSGRGGTGASGCLLFASRRADQDQRVLPELAFFYGGGQGVESGADDQLVRPGHLVGDHARGVLWVAACQELLLQLAGPGGRQEQRHRGAVPGELPDLLPRRHRRLAAAQPGQDHRLGDLRDGQLTLDGGGYRGEAGHAGDDLGVQAEFGTPLELLLDGAPERGVAGVHPGDGQLVPRRALVVGQHAFHGKLRRVDDLRMLARVGQDALVDQARRPDHDVGGRRWRARRAG